MAPHAGVTFDGATFLTDTHDIVQARAGASIWIPEFSPAVLRSLRILVQRVLWLLHDHGLCCAIAGEFPAYLAGKIVTQPELLRVYVAYNAQTESPDIDVMLQKNRTNSFIYTDVKYKYEHSFSTPCNTICYTARFKEVCLAVKIKCVDSTVQCGPRSSLNFLHFLWTTYAFCC
jgi:hypothetical protein